MKTKICQIHGSDMFESHPADPENGPSPHDVYNDLYCLECEVEELTAYEESVCLAHRSEMGSCTPCYVESLNDTEEV